MLKLHHRLPMYRNDVTNDSVITWLVNIHVSCRHFVDFRLCHQCVLALTVRLAYVHSNLFRLSNTNTLIVLTANSDIYKYGVFGSELHIFGRFHLLAHWVTTVYLLLYVVLSLYSTYCCNRTTEPWTVLTNSQLHFKLLRLTGLFYLLYHYFL